MNHAKKDEHGGQETFEIADIFREYGKEYKDSHRLCSQQYKAIRAIVNCRTAVLGGNLYQCKKCDYKLISYNSCRNRHCPKCQSVQKERWVSARQAELLPTEYFHVVFTLPHNLNTLAQGKPELIYKFLFQAVSETLLKFSSDPKWLGAKPSITIVLHTWGQNIDQHIHAHCIISGGGLTKEQKWKKCKRKFLFPVRALSNVFKNKYLEKLRASFKNKDINLPNEDINISNEKNIQKFMTSLYKLNWVVYAKPPFAGPEQVLSYLGRYTHKIAIANHRIVNLNNNKVAFKWRDYADESKQKVMNLDANEFIRRYLLHVLPKGFQRLRHYGLLANRYKQVNLILARAALNQVDIKEYVQESINELMMRITGKDINACPNCGAGNFNISVAVLPKWIIHSGDPPIDSSKD